VRRKRRTSQGTWLPTLGDVIVEEPATARSGRSLSLGLNAGAGGFSTGVVSITTDRPRQDPTEADSLADVIGSEWFLKRIVGSCFCCIRLTRTPNTFPDPSSAESAPALVSCGFFVARADPANPDEPVGFSETDGLENAYNPLNERNIREPWIWRRSWILGLNTTTDRDGVGDVTPGAIQDTATAMLQSYPASNVLYGSVADGPKIDAKTKRRITNDDRLFFAASLCRAQFEIDDTRPAAALIYLDYRIFGQSRRPRNRGVF